LAVSTWTVWQLARAHKLIPIHVGNGSTRWRRRDVLAYIDGQLAAVQAGEGASHA
jgi:hypothetical protein